KAMAESKAICGGELSGHFYFRDHFNCDSGMLALAQTLNMLTRTAASLSDLVKPLLRYAGSGERNFENPHADATLGELSKIYPDARIDYLDGVTVQFDDWWFNVRKSNTEPLLRLNLEASTSERMEEKLQEVAKHLGTPVEH
ncbi:MAG: phosphomannomutase/phosphoglucomutase, partial [Planctomycetes bacterium]|nr:phosphomannomutase/phosphoglucomutase [Planctomycetota bacterium]